MWHRPALRLPVFCVSVFVLALLLLPAPLLAACLGAVAGHPAARIMPAAYRPALYSPTPYSLAAAAPNTARITFIGHATFLIESAQGATAATDYNDYIRPPVRPDIVTMNYAHTTHFTDSPEPGIAHVLRGWTHQGKQARHNVQYRDMRVRNVPTNLRNYSSGTEYDGNSIFIFDVSQLCIAHLGHLHHKLTPGHLADLGKIDVLMVPVDGGFTLNIFDMQEVIAQIGAPLLIPMHYFSDSTLERFLARLRGSHDIRLNEGPMLEVSRASLPKKPTVVVLPGPH
jgi:L-ascorbate metabolism protein UlaG (beta-lactamase superfamily)